MRIIRKSKLIENESIINLLEKLNFLSVNQLAAKHILNTAWSLTKFDIQPMKSVLQCIQRNERSMSKAFLMVLLHVIFKMSNYCYCSAISIIALQKQYW